MWYGVRIPIPILWFHYPGWQDWPRQPRCRSWSWIEHHLAVSDCWCWWSGIRMGSPDRVQSERHPRLPARLRRYHSHGRVGTLIQNKLQSHRPSTHFYSFFLLWSKGLYSFLTIWVTHFPYLIYSPAGCGVPFPGLNPLKTTYHWRSLCTCIPTCIPIVGVDYLLKCLRSVA